MKNTERVQDWYNQVAEYSPEQRQNWYSDVADAYHRVRPRYPQTLIERAIAVAQLSPTAKILELGCGPGIATLPLAQRGFSFVCIEPSASACALARQTCAAYPAVEVINSTFEAETLAPATFDAVLAANAWHWLPPTIRCDKAANVLVDRGTLILLWNMSPQLPADIYQAVTAVYQTHAPSLIAEPEDPATQQHLVQALAQDVSASGRFETVLSEHQPAAMTYSIEDYLLLLNTFSPYRMITAQQRSTVFTALRQTFNHMGLQTIPVTYLAAFNVAHKAIKQTLP
jgi:SAM-dependent methyltransferase